MKRFSRFAGLLDERGKVAHVFDFLAVNADNDVADLNAGCLSRRFFPVFGFDKVVTDDKNADGIELDADRLSAGNDFERRQHVDIHLLDRHSGNLQHHRFMSAAFRLYRQRTVFSLNIERFGSVSVIDGRLHGKGSGRKFNRIAFKQDKLLRNLPIFLHRFGKGDGRQYTKEKHSCDFSRRFFIQCRPLSSLPPTPCKNGYSFNFA